MAILEQETYEQFGYYPSELKPHSRKKILAACDGCGKVRITSKNQYRSLCNSCCQKGEKNPMFGMTGEKNPMFGMTGEKNPMFGKHHSEEIRRLLSEAKKGKHHSEEHRRNNSEAHKGLQAGENHPMFGMTGEKAPNWKGGLSFGKYCPKFNPPFKERVRMNFDRKCFECGMTEEENGIKLDVHHVNYDKMVCCNDVEPLFAALCHSCNAKANKNREWWEEHFTEKLMAEKNSKCYFTKAEVENSLLRWKIL